MSKFQAFLQKGKEQREKERRKIHVSEVADYSDGELLVRMVEIEVEVQPSLALPEELLNEHGAVFVKVEKNGDIRAYSEKRLKDRRSYA